MALDVLAHLQLGSGWRRLRWRLRALLEPLRTSWGQQEAAAEEIELHSLALKDELGKVFGIDSAN